MQNVNSPAIISRSVRYITQFCKNNYTKYWIYTTLSRNNIAYLTRLCSFSTLFFILRREKKRYSIHNDLSVINLNLWKSA